MADVVTLVRSTRYPVGATPADGGVHATETVVAPTAAVAVTDDGVEIVAVGAVPVPRPLTVQYAHAVLDTVISTAMRTVTRRARTPRRGAARRARVFGGVGAGISCSPSPPT